MVSPLFLKPDDRLDNGELLLIVCPFNFNFLLGQFRSDGGRGVRFVPSGKFADIAQQDGFKIEGLALKRNPNGMEVLYAGTDDENFGATLRQVAPFSGR